VLSASSARSISCRRKRRSSSAPSAGSPVG
jgi:hypothetical protein